VSQIQQLVAEYSAYRIINTLGHSSHRDFATIREIFFPGTSLLEHMNALKSTNILALAINPYYGRLV